MSARGAFRLKGRILYVTDDALLLKRQLAGEDLPFDPDRKLRDNISTDEITPGWVCFYYDETLGQYTHVGLKGGAVEAGAIAKGGFDVIVSGLSKGCGSSRETAPYSEKAAGIRLVIAKSIEKIYRQNSHNIGLLTSTDLSLIPRLLKGEEIPLDEFTRGLDEITRSVVSFGGLFDYSKALVAGAAKVPVPSTAARPMNLVEKIIARHAVTGGASDGVAAVAPGDSLFVRTDIRFSHEYVTPMAETLFRGAFGDDAKVQDPASVYAFQDHLTFIGKVMPEEKRKMGLLERAEGLGTTQEAFTKRQGIRLYGLSAEGGAEAICHNAVVEDLALPGQLVAGTDSHTCMAGVLGCFAFGVGSTDIANAWATKTVRVQVPDTVRFLLRGRLHPGVVAKDVMLFLLSQEFFRTSRGIGKVLEFAGEGVYAMPMDERATLTNMAVEAGGFTGIIEPDEMTVAYVAAMRAVSPESVRARVLHADPDAQYAETFEYDLSSIVPMIATPGDPRNGMALSAQKERVVIQKAYGGSCTGGKQADMDQYAAVLRGALDSGRHVAAGVEFYIQYGSQHIRRYALEKGYDELFRRAGATVLEPSCGACINAGPGASKTADEVTISAQNRNFPGRSGPGKVYLASPLTVAASAVEGVIASAEPYLAAAAR